MNSNICRADKISGVFLVRIKNIEDMVCQGSQSWCISEKKHCLGACHTGDISETPPVFRQYQVFTGPVVYGAFIALCLVSRGIYCVSMGLDVFTAAHSYPLKQGILKQGINDRVRHEDGRAAFMYPIDPD